MNRTTVLLLCLALCPAVASAQSRVYQWTDPNGVRQYSQTPPPKGSAAERDIRTAEGKAATPAAPKAKTADEKACEQATENAAMLASTRVIASKDSDGEPAVMSADERTAAKTRTQAEIDLYCKR